MRPPCARPRKIEPFSGSGSRVVAALIETPSVGADKNRNLLTGRLIDRCQPQAVGVSGSAKSKWGKQRANPLVEASRHYVRIGDTPHIFGGVGRARTQCRGVAGVSRRPSPSKPTLGVNMRRGGVAGMSGQRQTRSPRSLVQQLW